MAKKAMSRNPQPNTGWRDRVQQAMKARNYSMRETGMKSGLGATSVRHLITNAQTTTLDTICRLASVLGVTPEWLAFGIENAEPAERASNISDEARSKAIVALAKLING